MYEDESDVRDHLESGTKPRIRKPLTQVDQLTEEEKLERISLVKLAP